MNTGSQTATYIFAFRNIFCMSVYIMNEKVYRTAQATVGFEQDMIFVSLTSVEILFP